MYKLSANYERILEVLQKVSEEQLSPYQRCKPKLSDLELISLCLTVEYISIESESELFRMLPEAISVKIDDSVYNKRRRKLAAHL